MDEVDVSIRISLSSFLGGRGPFSSCTAAGGGTGSRFSQMRSAVVVIGDEPGTCCAACRFSVEPSFRRMSVSVSSRGGSAAVAILSFLVVFMVPSCRSGAASCSAESVAPESL